MRLQLLLLFSLASRSAIAFSGGDEQSVNLTIRSDTQIYDTSPNCEKSRKVFQGNFGKLLKKSPECKGDRLYLTFKKKEIYRIQSLRIKNRTWADAQKVCDDWLKEEGKRLRSTFLFGNCYPPKANWDSPETAAWGSIISLPAMEKLDLSPLENFYSNQVKSNGDELGMEVTNQYFILFSTSVWWEDFPKYSKDLSKHPIQDVCETWRREALKKFSMDLLGIEPCTVKASNCNAKICIYANSRMDFKNPVQRFNLHKSFDGRDEQKSATNCQAWLKQLQDFNPEGYVMGDCKPWSGTTYQIQKPSR